MKNNYWKHKTAEIEKGANIGKGTKIWHHCQIKKGAVIGNDCTVGHNCFIAEGAVIGNNVKIQSNTDIWDKVVLQDYVFVGPSAVFTNDKNPRSKYPKGKDKWIPTLVKEGATIGANATIVCGVVVGKWAMVGAGAVIKKDVIDYAIVVGQLQKIIGYMCECGNKLKFSGEKSKCKECKREYQKKKGIVWEIKN